HSTDGGLTWTPLQLLNTTATSDGTATDRFGSIVADAQGNWIVAWESNADLGGVTGGEGDILYTTRSFPPVLDRDNVYVDFNASTNGNGLPQTPFHNLADAIAVVNPAGIVHVAPGVSSEVFDGPAA